MAALDGLPLLYALALALLPALSGNYVWLAFIGMETFSSSLSRSSPSCSGSAPATRRATLPCAPRCSPASLSAHWE